MAKAKSTSKKSAKKSTDVSINLLTSAYDYLAELKETAKVQKMDLSLAVSTLKIALATSDSIHTAMDHLAKAQVAANSATHDAPPMSPLSSHSESIVTLYRSLERKANSVLRSGIAQAKRVVRSAGYTARKLAAESKKTEKAYKLAAKIREMQERLAKLEK